MNICFFYYLVLFFFGRVVVFVGYDVIFFWIFLVFYKVIFVMFVDIIFLMVVLDGGCFYLNEMNVIVNIFFSEKCENLGGFVCMNISFCEVYGGMNLIL